jgi:hypothetical protein
MQGLPGLWTVDVRFNGALPAWSTHLNPLLLLTPPCPLTAASLLGLKATVLLLITLLIKARIQIKLASALGLFLLALQTLLFLAAAGALGLAALGALFTKPFGAAGPTVQV